ncbi:MAG: 2-amino-4-hydroxy-6-hydroxymethyldihydropteridine diphosphokinase [Cyanobacteria bacterium J06639_1]
MHYATPIQTNADPLPQASPIPQHARVALGIGSNLGDPQQQILQGLQALDRHAGIAIAKLSPFFWTAPVYQHAPPPVPHPPYLNGAAILDTELAPQALMRVCLDVEASLGRVRHAGWTPRPLDLDILLWERQQFDLPVRGCEPAVTVPHPRMSDRAFVLIPLSHIAPHWRFPQRSLPSDPNILELARAASSAGIELDRPVDLALPESARPIHHV